MGKPVRLERQAALGETPRRGQNAQAVDLTHQKDLNRGDFLVDDRTKNGADRFAGELIHFSQPRFPDWKAALDYLRQRA